jgi:hypothetical protein
MTDLFLPEQIKLKQSILGFLFLLLSSSIVSGQQVFVLNDSASTIVTSFGVIPGDGLTFREILKNPKLPYTTNDSLSSGQAQSYWIRVIVKNPSSYSRKYDIQASPALSNTFYYFDQNRKRWTEQQSGVLVRSRKNSRLKGIFSCVLQANAVSTIYFKFDISSIKDTAETFHPRILLKTPESSWENEQYLWTIWGIGITVLILFFLNNLYIYFSFRDKTVLYYLICQLGGMIYITSYRHFFSAAFYSPVFSFLVRPSGPVDTYDLNFVLMHFSLLLIMYGLVQFTRSFLNAPKTLPALNKILKYALVFYITVTVTIMIVNICWFYLENYTIAYENLMALILILILLYTCLIGYRRKIRAAGAFLFANILPFAFMAFTALFHFVMRVRNTETTLLPDMAIITQSLGFSIALVARTKLIQKDLKRKETQALKLEFDLREAGLRNEMLQQNLEANQRELASTTMYMVQKNELMARLKVQVHELGQPSLKNKEQKLHDIESTLQSDKYMDSDWGKFKLHFEQVHPHFFENLLAKHPSLTKYEIRLCAYFHINLSTKEIAALLNIDPASVRRAKTRLYKKMALAEGNAPA